MLYKELTPLCVYAMHFSGFSLNADINIFIQLCQNVRSLLSLRFQVQSKNAYAGVCIWCKGCLEKSDIKSPQHMSADRQGRPC